MKDGQQVRRTYSGYTEASEEIYRNGQPMARRYAVSRCIDFGYEYVELFKKFYEEGVHSESFELYCAEMTAKWNNVKDIKMSNGKNISDSKLVDWFFTSGSVVRDLFPDEAERIVYCKLMNELLKHKDSVISDILEMLLSAS